MTKPHFRPDLVPMMRFMVENDMDIGSAALVHALFPDTQHLPDTQHREGEFSEWVIWGCTKIYLSTISKRLGLKIWAFTDDFNPIGSGRWVSASLCNFETGEVHG